MIKIYTSYFGQLKNLAKDGIIPISIARYSPGYFRGRSIMCVAPAGPMLSMKDEEYKTAYAEILRHVDVNKLIKEIQAIACERNVALLCYEKPGEFCHRRLLAEWIERSLGIETPEYGVTKNPEVKQLTLF